MPIYYPVRQFRQANFVASLCAIRLVLEKMKAHGRQCVCAEGVQGRSAGKRCREEVPDALQSELVTLMARLEAKFLVEPVSVGTAFVGRELDQAASPRPAFGDRPFEHLLA